MDPERALAYLTSHMQARANAVERVAVRYSTLADLLPNTLYEEPGGPPRPLTDLVAMGRITAVTKGRGFYAPTGDAPGGVEIPFDDSRAQWKTIRLKFRVERGFDHVSRAGSTLAVGVALGGGADFGLVSAGFRALGAVVLFLRRGSPVFAYDPSLLAILEDGALVARVTEYGGLDLPFVGRTRSAGLTQGVGSVEALTQTSQRPDRLIPLAAQGSTP